MRCTPALLIRKLRAANRARQAHRQDLLWQAFMGEIFHRTPRLNGRVLDRYMRPLLPDDGRKAQTADDIERAADAWAARLGVAS